MPASRDRRYRCSSYLVVGVPTASNSATASVIASPRSKRRAEQVEKTHAPFPSAAARSLNLAVATTRLPTSQSQHVIADSDCHS